MADKLNAPRFPQLFSDDEVEARATRKPAPPRPGADPMPIVRSKFPHIAERIGSLWGTKACDAYLDELLIDDRGNRQGFPPEVATALFKISREHEHHFGFCARYAAHWTPGSRR
jgi:hypothetical protein